MAQPPFKADSLQVEPGSGDTLLIERDAVTGALKFTDAVVTGGILLNQLAGLRSIGNVLVVGKSGTGAAYTTIQSAIDAVPSLASPTNPYIILVMPGVYEETINIVRNGVSLVGLGRPTLKDPLNATPNAPGNDHTVILSSQLGTTPEFCLIEGFEIHNAHDNKAALRIVGGAASTVGEVGIYIKSCTLWDDSLGGGRPLWVTACNFVETDLCRFGGGLGSLVVGEEAARLCLRSAVCEAAVSLRWDTAQDLPSQAHEAYIIENSHQVASETGLSPAVSVDLDGGGSLLLLGMSMGSAKRLQLSGDQSGQATNSVLGVVSLLETSTLALLNSTYSSLLAGNLNAEFNGSLGGTQGFAASATETVTFGIPQPDDSYDVALELDSHPANDEPPWVTNKGASGFDIEFNTAQTLNVRWRIRR